MTPRVAVFQRMVNDASLNELVEGRIFPKKGMTSSIEQHPYIIYKLGVGFGEGLSEEVEATRQYLQFYVHDFSDTETGDYVRIDEVIERLYQLFNNWSSAEANIILTRKIETSQDLDDDTLGTVMKYIRFYAMVKELP